MRPTTTKIDVRCRRSATNSSKLRPSPSPSCTIERSLFGATLRKIHVIFSEINPHHFGESAWTKRANFTVSTGSCSRRRLLTRPPDGV